MRVKPLPPTSLRLVPPSTRLPPVREQALRPGLLLRPPRPWHPRQHRRATCRRRTRRKEPARPLQVAQHAAANRGGLCNPCGLVHRVWEVNRRAHGPAVARSLTPTRFALSKRLYQPCGGPKETLVRQQLCGSAPAATAAQQALPATAWGSPTCSMSRGRTGTPPRTIARRSARKWPGARAGELGEAGGRSWAPRRAPVGAFQRMCAVILQRTLADTSTLT